MVLVVMAMKIKVFFLEYKKELWKYCRDAEQLFKEW